MTLPNAYKHHPFETPCKSCGTLMVWFKTRAGKRMPVDASTTEPTDAVLDTSRHIAHFATCPHADKHRKRTA